MPVVVHILAYCTAWAAAVGVAAAGALPVAVLLVLLMAAVAWHRQTVTRG